MTEPLTIAQVVTLLDTTVPILQREVAALPVAITQLRPAPGEWSVNEVIGHLIETEERGFGGRIARIVARDGYLCQAWDPDQVARDRHDQEKATTTLLTELAERRSKNLHLVQALAPAQLMRTAIHPVVGPLSVNELLHEWVFHDRNHIKQILTNVQSWLWPTMGNTQRFTTG